MDELTTNPLSKTPNAKRYYQSPQMTPILQADHIQNQHGFGDDGGVGCACSHS